MIVKTAQNLGKNRMGHERTPEYKKTCLYPKQKSIQFFENSSQILMNQGKPDHRKPYPDGGHYIPDFAICRIYHKDVG
jgi:hypothetical protein